MNTAGVKAEDDEHDGRGLLLKLIELGFEGGVEQTALALGRTTEELDDIIAGNEEPDEDLVMKVRGLAQERDIRID